MALDKILQGIVSDFQRKYTLEGNESRIFEHIVNYITVAKYHPEAFNDAGDFESISVDKKGLFGIDGIAFVVNGNLVTSKNDISDYAKSKYLDVTMLVIQAKTEEKCESGDLLKTISATKSFLGDHALLTETSPELNNAYEIYAEIFKYSKYFNATSPQCVIHFVTAARTWDKTLVAGIVSAAEAEIPAMFPEIKIAKVNVYGSSYVIDTYSELENSVDVQINFKNYLSFDKINDIEQSYLGYLSGDEYLKIIMDSHDDIRTRIFYENVRDYQGVGNPVNKEIRHTLETRTLRDKFVLLNNGITIVTKHFKSLGSNMFELREFQVVNGCQTSHEIYNARQCAKDILVPVKIIHTTDQDVISMIVKSTNRQTPVPNEAFVALESYHKHLQQVFEEYSKEMPLTVFYERRSGELALRKNSENCYEVATLHSIIRSVTSVYFQEPYIVYNNNPANILKNRQLKLFQEDQPYEIYYISYYLFACFLDMAAKKKFNSFEYKLRFYIIMVARCILSKRAICDALNSKSTRIETKDLVSLCKCEHDKICCALTEAKEIVDELVQGKKDCLDQLLRSPQFNSTVLSEAEKKYHTIDRKPEILSYWNR
ncbi:MAG: hypothetical protein E7425_09980 [Ruminococcaceae bacterium]|nr:hypothetical protein [Oscillospiraceae bacterium]